MWRTALAIGLVASVSAIAAVKSDVGCEADPEMRSKSFAGEVFGSKPFVTSVGPNEFQLIPAPYGWQITVIDKERGTDLALTTPPVRQVQTNPRMISGWHFRNAANTGPNAGDVNAPQKMRKFIFGSMASDPARNPELIAPGAGRNAATVEPNEGEYGHGELIIEDFGLADLAPGQKARMVYLKFRGCAAWVRGYEPATLRGTADPGVPDEVVARMQECGLNPGTFKLSDRMTKGREGGQNAYLTPDLDGDGLADFVAPIERRYTGEPGLAICLASNNRLVLAGYRGRIGAHLDPAFFTSVDYWGVYDGGITQGVGEGKPPLMPGDAIVFGKEGASSVLLYLNADLKPSSYWQGD